MSSVSRILLLVLALLSPQAVFAGDKPLIEPAPAWVEEAKLAVPANLKDQAIPQILLLDRQIRFDAGKAQVFISSASLVKTAEQLTAAGNIAVPWHPDKGELRFHRLDVLRGGKVINVLASGQKFAVIRREAKLEQAWLDGVLTATMQIEDVQVGDTLHMAFSISYEDPALGGQVNDTWPMSLGSTTIGTSNFRLLWSADHKLDWRTFDSRLKPKVRTVGGLKELTLNGPFPGPPDPTPSAPLRFASPSVLEASSFASWPDVSRTAFRLYDSAGEVQKDPTLVAAVAEIAAQSKDPKVRAALALRLVQDKVRYLFNGMAQGGYVPTKPTETWKRRFGDCKGKTLLLLAILHELGIEAEPALVNANQGDLVEKRLPGFQLFDHVIVRATIAGKTYWLDGTRLGDRIEDLEDVPNFGFALPLRKEGASLERLVAQAPVRPLKQTQIEIDASAGIAFPTPYKMTIVLRGQEATLLKLYKAGVGEKEFETFLRGVIDGERPDTIVFTKNVAFNDLTGEAVVTATGMTNLDWATKDEKRRAELATSLTNLNINVERTNPADADVPYLVSFPAHNIKKMTIKLPKEGQGFSLGGQADRAVLIAGTEYTQNATLSGGTYTLVERARAVATEFPASEMPSSRSKLADAVADPFQIIAPKSWPTEAVERASVKKTGGLKAIIAAYDAGVVAAKPDDFEALKDRARFYDANEENEKALADVSRVTAKDPSVANYLWRAGLLKEKFPLKAISDILAARKLEPKSTDALIPLVMLRLDRKEGDLALKEIEEAKQAGGDRSALYQLRAQVFEKTGKLDEAVSEMNKAIALSPGSPDLLNELCWMKATHNTALDSALKDCTKAIALMDDPTPALDSRGFVYLQMKRYDDAIVDFDAALKQSPEMAASLFSRGVAKIRKGDRPGGEKDLAAARLITKEIDKAYAGYGVVP